MALNIRVWADAFLFSWLYLLTPTSGTSFSYFHPSNSLHSSSFCDFPSPWKQEEGGNQSFLFSFEKQDRKGSHWKAENTSHHTLSTFLSVFLPDTHMSSFPVRSVWMLMVMEVLIPLTNSWCSEQSLTLWPSTHPSRVKNIQLQVFARQKNNFSIENPPPGKWKLWKGKRPRIFFFSFV